MDDERPSTSRASYDNPQPSSSRYDIERQEGCYESTPLLGEFSRRYDTIDENVETLANVSVRESVNEALSSLRDSTDGENTWINDFYSQKRVRHCSNRNTTIQYEEVKNLPPDCRFNQNVESLNYDSYWRTETKIRQRQALQRLTKEVGPQPTKKWWRKYLNESTELLRLVICTLIGILVPAVAMLIYFCIDKVAANKHWLFARFTDIISEEPHVMVLVIPGWVVFDMLIATFGCIAISFIEPRAGGSGVPELRCYINGIAVPRVVRLRTMLARMFGLLMIPSCDLPLGDAEPMVHMGGSMAAGISQGRASAFHLDLNIFKKFRNDVEKRDFVTAGAASGFTAAFGTPIAAVLFTMEHLSTYWTQKTIWRTMWTAMVSACVVHFIASVWHPTESVIGSAIFGVVPEFTVPWLETAIALGVGAIGSILGVIFVALTRWFSILRITYRSRRFRLAEVIVLSTALVCLFVPLLWLEGPHHCFRVHPGSMTYPLRAPCPEGETNSLGMLLLQLPSKTFQALVYESAEVFRPSAVLLFALYMFFGNAAMYGTILPGGVILPNFVIGAAWGRLLGHGVFALMSTSLDQQSPIMQAITVEKFTVLGAAAQTAGVLRVFLTVPVMFAEATQSTGVGLATAVCSVTAKFLADFIWSVDFYTMWTRLLGYPYLPMEPDESPPHFVQLENLRAFEIMSSPVTFVRLTETVGNILKVLCETPHNGFPVVSQEPDHMTFGQLRGFIDRTTLLALLEHKELYTQDLLVTPIVLGADTFRRPRPPTLADIAKRLTEDDRQRHIVIADYMSIAPHVVQLHISFTRVYHMFRTLGLRHLPVVTIHNNLAGIITRKDLARFRCLSGGWNWCQKETNRFMKCEFVLNDDQEEDWSISAI